MNTIDLLPHHIQALKKRRVHLIIFATAQAAIFFVLIIAVLILSCTETRVWERSREISNILSGFDSAPMEISNELSAVIRESEILEAYFADEFIFESEWLGFIIDSVPEGAELTGVIYRDGEFIISGMVSLLADIEHHRAILADKFSSVSLGSIANVDDTCFNYELTVRVSDLP